MNDEQLYQIALSMIPDMSIIDIKELLNNLGSPEAVFERGNISNSADIPSTAIKAISDGSLISAAEKEIKTMAENRITGLFYLEDRYPNRLRECPDAPIMLYCRGYSDLETPKVLSIVGTRRATPLGRETAQQLIRELSEKFKDLVIVSGLAYGIDAISHQAALQNGLVTVGVLAHGLHEVYPSAHRRMAEDMLMQGGQLLSEHPWGTPSLPYRFRQRNRIIAGLSDACVVIESDVDGGSLITAKFAREYDRDVLAFPGRIIDKYSKGCNEIIKLHTAGLVESAEDVIRELNWKSPRKRKASQQSLFAEMPDSHKMLLDILHIGEIMTANDLSIQTDLKINEILSILMELEMEDIIECLPGGRYRRKSFS